MNAPLSPILFCPTLRLRELPGGERDVLRRLFGQYLRGMGRKNRVRLFRLARAVFYAEPGEGFQIYRVEERGGPFHNRHRAILERLFHSQEHFTDEDLLHDWIKLRCWFVTFGEGPIHGRPIPVPRSTRFDRCSEDEMREFHQKFEHLLHMPWVQRRFWPHLSPALRAEMVESVLADPKQENHP